MTNEQPDFFKWMQDLTARSVAEQTRAWQRYNDLMQRLLRGELNDPQVREDYLRFAREESARYASDLAQLSLGYYSALLELGRSYNDRFFEQVLHGAKHGHEHEGRMGPDGEAAEGPRQVMLDLHGPAGQELSASVVIENKHATPAEISLAVSDFIDVAGGSPFPAPLRLDPAVFRLGPHEEAVVKIRLPLARDLFLPGHLYRATVVVRGYDELELIIRVAVEPAAPEPEADRSQAAPPEAETPPPARRRTRGAASSAKKSAASQPRRKRAADND